MSIPDGGPAFPLPNCNWDSDGGMSLRDYFARAALPECMRLASTVHYNCETVHKLPWPPSAAEAAYQVADAMLKAREAKP